MKSTQSIGENQTPSRTLRLYFPPDPEDGFDPECDALDFLTSEVLSEAIRDDLKPPFRLQFFDADQVLLREERVTVRNGSVMGETVSRRFGMARVPLTCKLVDCLGQMHERTLSEKETRSWLSEPSFEGSYLGGTKYTIKSRKPSESPNFSTEVYVVLNKFLIICASRKLEPPMRIEVHDAQGRLFQTAEVHFRAYKYETRTELAECAHLPFPVTIKLISEKGLEFTETVERPQ